MEVLNIRIQSLEDAAKGIGVVEGSTIENTKVAKNFTVCLLEAGTVSGSTSLMFCLTDENGQTLVAEMTQGHLDGLVSAVKGAVGRFGK